MGYHRLTSPAYHDEAEDAPLTNGESKEDGNPHRYKKPSSWKMRFITGISIAMNVVTLMLCAALYSKITSQLDEDSKLHPFFEGVDDELYPNDFEAVHLSSSKFSQPVSVAGDKVEEEWIKIGAFYQPAFLPDKYAADFNFIPGKHLRYTPSDGDYALYSGYSADVAMTHYIHCVNLLRESLWFNYDYYRSIHMTSFNVPEGQEQAIIDHVSHCVDALRKMIMCEASLELWPFVTNADGLNVTDMSASTRKCKNYEARRKWVEKWQSWGQPHQVDDHHPSHWRVSG
ncbi:hypothetical protein CKM354_000227900 [Cercospora kikuchii]|uniref:Uncharacterized protein n=1 Tax=Cercospora kikuchii TaxID=84275 RepID=A0A9P3FDT7_9PEZI|nr:uncharacterized protein CKM354_000227900 [Cercospora kikuchii]GIZ38880.1 hypothetical protein CKM354_000227900 [Cercospora kikuchii]